MIKDNKGFSLVEVLVAVAVLAIVFTPVLNSFTTASKTNSRAQHIQNATSLAEDVMEKVKSTSIEQLHKESLPGGSGAKIGQTTVDASNIVFTGTSFTPSESTAFSFKPPYSFTYKNVTVTQGREYDAIVDITTDDYSLGSPSSTTVDASDANTFEVPKINKIDSTQHAVLSWEINSLDKSAIARLVDENKLNTSEESQMKADVKDAGYKTTTITLKKEVYTYTKEDGSSESRDMIKVSCSVEYDANTASCPKKVNHLVYTGYFDDISTSATGGPNVYLFYSTIRGAGGADFFKNESIIVDDQTSGMVHNIYLILQGKTNGMQDVTDMSHPIDISMKVVENGSQTDVPSNPTGEHANIIALNGTTAKLYTNLQTGSALENTEFDNNVGYKGGNLFDPSVRDRIYSVEVRVTKAGDPTEVYAILNSTMDCGEEAKTR